MSMLICWNKKTTYWTRWRGRDWDNKLPSKDEDGFLMIDVVLKLMISNKAALMGGEAGGENVCMLDEFCQANDTALAPDKHGNREVVVL